MIGGAVENPPLNILSVVVFDRTTKVVVRGALPAIRAVWA